MRSLQQEHDEFRTIVRDQVDYLIATTPEKFLDRYWVVNCFRSIEKFAARFAEPRGEQLEELREQFAAYRRLRNVGPRLTADIDLTAIMPPSSLPWH